MAVVFSKGKNNIFSITILIWFVFYSKFFQAYAPSRLQPRILGFELLTPLSQKNEGIPGADTSM
jgi:hypothetical protein